MIRLVLFAVGYIVHDLSVDHYGVDFVSAFSRFGTADGFVPGELHHDLHRTSVVDGQALDSGVSHTLRLLVPKRPFREGSLNRGFFAVGSQCSAEDLFLLRLADGGTAHDL